MKIKFEVIPHKKQRYNTLGDYFIKNNTCIIRSSKLGDKRYEFLVLLHEFVEWYLTSIKKIPEKKIYAYDVAFEKRVKRGEFKKTDEPGDQPDAPYHKQHRIACFFERMFAYLFFVNWKDYNRVQLKVWNKGR